MSIEKRKRLFTSWRYYFFLITKLPMCLIARVKVKSLNEQESSTTVPYNFINKILLILCILLFKQWLPNCQRVH